MFYQWHIPSCHTLPPNLQWSRHSTLRPLLSYANESSLHFSKSFDRRAFPESLRTLGEYSKATHEGFLFIVFSITNLTKDISVKENTLNCKLVEKKQMLVVWMNQFICMHVVLALKLLFDVTPLFRWDIIRFGQWCRHSQVSGSGATAPEKCVQGTKESYVAGVRWW